MWPEKSVGPMVVMCHFFGHHNCTLVLFICLLVFCNQTTEISDMQLEWA